MVSKHASTQPYPPRVRELLARGEARPPQHRLSDVLARIGAPKGPSGNAATRALQEQREDIV